MCFEGMEESGSEGLDEMIEDQKDKYFKGVDAVCISYVSCFSPRVPKRF
jgi:Cys-Gly metallodipeptidase DUG1